MIKLGPTNNIKIPGLPELILTQEGFNYAVLWVGKNEAGEFDQNYVCIEPVEGNSLKGFFGSSESLIQPGKKRTSHFSLIVKKQ